MLGSGRYIEQKIDDEFDKNQQLLLEGEKEYKEHEEKRFKKCQENNEPFIFGTPEDIKFINNASPALQYYLEHNPNFAINNLYVTEADKPFAEKKTSPAMLTISTEEIEEIDLSKYLPSRKAGKAPFTSLQELLKAYGLETLKLKAYWIGKGENRIPKFFCHNTSGNDKKPIREKERKLIQRIILNCFKYPEFADKKIHLSGDTQENPFKLSKDKESLVEKDGHMMLNDDPKESGSLKNILDNKKGGFGKLHVTSVNYPRAVRKKKRGDLILKGEPEEIGRWRGVNFAKLNQREKENLTDFGAKIHTYVFDGPFNPKIHQPNSKLLDNYTSPPIHAVGDFVTDKKLSGGDHEPEKNRLQNTTFLGDGGISLKKPKNFRNIEELYDKEKAFEEIDGKLELKSEVSLAEVAYSEKFFHIMVPKLAKINFSQPDAIPAIDPNALKLVDTNALDPKNAEKGLPLSTKTNKEYLADYRKILTDLHINPDAPEDKMLANFDFKNSTKMRYLSEAIDRFLIIQATDTPDESVKELRAAHEDGMEEFLKSKEFADGYHFYVTKLGQQAKMAFLNTPENFVNSDEFKKAQKLANDAKPDEHPEIFTNAAKQFKTTCQNAFEQGYKHPEAKDITKEYVKSVVKSVNQKSQGSSGRAPFNNFCRYIIDLESLGGFSAIAGSTNETNETMRVRLLYGQASLFCRTLISGAEKLVMSITETSTTELELKETTAPKLYQRAVMELGQFYSAASLALRNKKQAANDSASSPASPLTVEVPPTSPRISLVGIPGVSFHQPAQQSPTPREGQGVHLQVLDNSPRNTR